MPAHKHADSMRQYVEDAARSETPWEFWEAKFPGQDDWFPLNNHPEWHPMTAYRRKPKKIIINGHEINGPVREKLPYGTEYFLTFPTDKGLFLQLRWANGETEKQWLQHGLIHLIQEDAIAHAKALLSFTEVKR